jgi:hypothetical protein
MYYLNQPLKHHTKFTLKTSIYKNCSIKTISQNPQDSGKIKTEQLKTENLGIKWNT